MLTERENEDQIRDEQWASIARGASSDDARAIVHSLRWLTEEIAKLRYAVEDHK
jgi:hypothetical protein